MKLASRQHGLARCYQINQPLLAQERYTKMVDSATAARLFTKVLNKPTNQSKCTGKCHKGRCSGHHIHAICKSRNKGKGSMKIRSIDPQNDWTKYSFGTSATGVLAYLADEESYNDDDYDYEGRVEETYNYAYSYGYDDDNHHNYGHDDGFTIGIMASVAAHEHEIDVDVDDNDDDDDDDTMSFCDVGLCWGHGDGDEYGDDGWYLVGGQMY